MLQCLYFTVWMGFIKHMLSTVISCAILIALLARSKE